MGTGARRTSGTCCSGSLCKHIAYSSGAIGQQVRLHPSARVAWISTRRGEPAADSIAANVIGRFVLHDMMANMTAPLDELSTAHLVVLEAPPNGAARFEHDMLSLVSRIMAQGPEVAVMVQPSLRRKSNKTLWVHRWNRLTSAPFKFRQTRSCKASNNVPGCHLTCLIGATTAIDMSPCAEVPTLSATPSACVESLGGLLYSLCSCLLSAEGDGGTALPPPPRQSGSALVSAAPTGVATIAGIC